MKVVAGGEDDVDEVEEVGVRLLRVAVFFMSLIPGSSFLPLPKGL
jgi:hypothetical protein